MFTAESSWQTLFSVTSSLPGGPGPAQLLDGYKDIWPETYLLWDYSHHLTGSSP